MHYNNYTMNSHSSILTHHPTHSHYTLPKQPYPTTLRYTQILPLSCKKRHSSNPFSVIQHNSNNGIFKGCKKRHSSNPFAVIQTKSNNGIFIDCKKRHSYNPFAVIQTKSNNGIFKDCKKRHSSNLFAVIQTKSNYCIFKDCKKRHSFDPFAVIQTKSNNVNKLHITCSINDSSRTPQSVPKQKGQNSFWGAVSLIIGTAVGPGMLGLPALTIKSGPLPSTLTILLSWVYVISSIVLVAELSFATMEYDGVEEVSFTGLATKAFGTKFGTFVSVVYASLSFSLLVACVSGIGSLVLQWFPNLSVLYACSLFPLFVGCVIGFLPFQAIDSTNRFLCLLMLVSIVTLVGVGVSVSRTNLLASFGYSSWNVFSVLPAVPVTVLTLGFHVITPFICKIAGDTVDEARKAILVGGVVPLAMVLSWNLIVLGLSGNGKTRSYSDPIKLLLSVKSSALPAVQGFAFAALATSLIGYVVSFPKQLIDTFELIFGNNAREVELGGESLSRESGVVTKDELISSKNGFGGILRGLVSSGVLIVPVLVASFYPSTFSKALDYAGVYANCFLFGILPPAMAYIYKSRGNLRSSLPGGNMMLFLLFSVAVILSIWH